MAFSANKAVFVRISRCEAYKIGINRLIMTLFWGYLMFYILHFPATYAYQQAH